jgi:hypothetical protein
MRMDVPGACRAVQPVVGLFGRDRLGLHRVDDVDEAEVRAQVGDEGARPVTPRLPQEPGRGTLDAVGAEEAPHPGDVVGCRPEALRALQEHGGGPEDADALERPLPGLQHRRRGAERAHVPSVVLLERALHPPVRGAPGLVGDQLPGLDRELEGRRCLRAPASEDGVCGRLVERVLHLDEREPRDVGRHRDRPAAEPDAGSGLLPGLRHRAQRWWASTSSAVSSRATTSVSMRLPLMCSTRRRWPSWWTTSPASGTWPRRWKR